MSEKEPYLFLNHRVDDASGEAKSLSDKLAAALGSDHVFLDASKLEAGGVWTDDLQVALERTTVLLAVIGPKWLQQHDEWGRRRIDQEDDWVRREIAWALEHDATVVPVLVRDASIPPKAALPDSLAALSARQTFSVHRGSFDRDVDALIDLLVSKHRFVKKAETASTRPLEPSGLDAEVQDYLERAASLHDGLPLPGFETNLMVPIRLDDLYLPLHVRPDLRATGDIVFADAKDAEKAMRAERVERDIALADAFQQAGKSGHRRGIVVLGDPGSGKTTQLKRLLLWLCRAEPEKLGLPEGCVPVFLPLRELRADHLRIDAFVAERLESDHLLTSEGFGKRLLQRGKLLFLFDGLDEVADPKTRSKVARAIEHARADYPDSYFAVTCRYAGYTKSVRLPPEFLVLHLRPLDDAQVETFVQGWYHTVETGIDSDAERAAQRAADGAAALLDRLREPDFRAQRVYELTHNPLLLTGICLVHRSRGGQLPRGRAQLYKESANVLLERWRASKELQITLGADEARQVLQPMAYWLHGEENRTRATAEELEPVLREPLRNLARVELGPAGFLKAIRDESGLLTGWSDKTYGFMHLGFQEYLAALQIRSLSHADKTVLDQLASRFGESWWREVTLLVLALGDPPLFEPLMQRVMQRAAFAEHADLVDACAEDAISRKAAPFVKLLRASPENDKGLWDRQLTAFRVLQRHWPAEADALADGLRQHPSAEIRGLLKDVAAPVATAGESGYELVRIPAGKFRMGSPEREKGRRDNEGPLHDVEVPAFELGRYPVTNEQYGAYLEANPESPKPEYWGDRSYNQPHQPVVGVSWKEARAFCGWAGLRLPSEAEWEYACRAGTRTRFWAGKADQDLARVGWYDDNSDGRLHAVGEKEPNPFGLYDMHGNVLEWCEDTWHNTYDDAPEDGRAWVDEGSVYRVLRGGSWYRYAWWCRSAFRLYALPGYRHHFVGFRPARSSPSHSTT